jgi:hypothetical protein
LGGDETRKAYVRVYGTTNLVAPNSVFFDFCTSRSGAHPLRMLKDFKGTLLQDDYSG